MSLLAVASGGAFGAVSRYLASGWVQQLTGGFFPWGTFAVNVAGSLLLGFALIWLQGTVVSAEMRELVTVVRGIAGFGPAAKLHTGKVLRLSSDLPVIVEVVDDEENLRRLLPAVDELMGGGLITMEKAHVVMYRGE